MSGMKTNGHLKKPHHFKKICSNPTTTANDEDDAHLRKVMSDIYRSGFIRLISNQKPGVMGGMEKMPLYFLLSPRKKSLSETDFGCLIHFGDIQRMHMRSLHSRLINVSVKLQKSCSARQSKESLTGLDEFGAILEKYVRAVQDHEYMSKFALKANDPFVASSRRHNDHILFEAALMREGLDFDDLLPPTTSRSSRGGQSSTTDDEEKDGERRHREWIERLIKASIPAGPWETFGDGDVDTPASALINTRTTSAKKAFWTRVGAAVIGGAFLIAPMWIMALQRNLFVHLGVATGCVTAFGVSVSLYLETVDVVFAATLAYAAVIMVFVGIVIEETGSKGA